LTDLLAPPTRRLPARALVLSLLALLVPVVAVLFLPEWTEDEAGVLLWLTALVPAFLLTYYRGWKGASVALALGMAVLSVTQVVVLGTGIQAPNWALLLGVVVAFLLIGLGIGWMAELLHRERRAAELMALTDPLTDLPNRRHAQIVLERAAAAAERGFPLSVVFFDLDHFKRFNDEHGHRAGDEVLKSFAAVLRKVTRKTDVGARFGGEEFLSVLWGADATGAGFFLSRVLHELKQNPSPWGPVSVSAGVATYADGWGSPDLLLAAADRALYSAKRAGRSRCYLAGPRGYTEMEVPDFVPAPPAPPAWRQSRPTRTVTPLPPVDSTLPPLEGEAARAEAGLPESRNEVVLLVAEDEAGQKGLAKLLRRAGYRVRTAGDGDEALVTLRDAPGEISLLVTDVVTPRMSGFVLADRALAAAPGLRVIYMSGYSHAEVARNGVPGRVVGFLQKPTTLREVASVVRQVLDAPDEATVGVPPGVVKGPGSDSFPEPGHQ
jgi:diguanylate cyclase (GGDEF)-like protein